MKPALPGDTAEALYDNAPCGYVSTLSDGTIVRVNQTFLNFTGRTRAELLAGRRLQDLLTAPGRLYCETHLLPLLLQHHSVKEVACELQRPALEPLPALLNCTDVRDADGTVGQLRFTFFDASERRRFEAELLQSRHQAEHFRAIVEASADAILSIGPGGLVQSWNAAAERLFGHPAAQAIGRHVSELIVPEDTTVGFGALLSQLRAGRAVERDTVCTRPDGVRINVSITLSPHVEPPHGLISVSGIVRDTTEQSRAQARLRESEQQFRTIFELAPAGVVLIDPTEGTIVACNEEAARANGYSQQDFVGRKVLDIVAPSHHGHSVMRRDRILAEGGDAYDSQHLSKSGELRDVHVTVRLVTIGGATRMLSLWEDITVRRGAEVALRESRARLELGVRVAGLALADIDYGRGRIQLSAEAARLFGIGDEAMSVRREVLHDTFHPDDRQEVLRQIDATLEPASSGWFAMELRVLLPTRAVRWLRVRKQVFFAEGEGPLRRPVAAIIAALDISAEKAAQEALEQERRFIERLTDVVPSILYVFDLAAQRHVWVNRQAGAALGYPPQAAAQWGPDFRLQNIHPEDLQRVAEQTPLLLRLADGQTHETEYRLRHHDGAWRWFRSRETVFKRDASGQVLEVIGVASDVDASRQAQQALLDADRKKDNFIATLAHELRNPLAPIRNAVKVMRRQGPPDPELVWCRDVIERQVAQMAHLLEDLLDVARITQGRLTLRRELLDVSRFIEQAIEIAQPLIDERRHSLSVLLPEKALTVAGDLTRLAQVFSNLLINAAKYTPEGGRITLTAESDDSVLLLRIRDNGSGISAEHLTKVFEMFSRGAALQVHAQDGLGIGLSLVKGLVDLHGGRVKAYSAGLGQGSEFAVHLPLAAAAPPAPAHIALDIALHTATAAAPAKLRVLVADDSTDIADSLHMLLGLEGFDVSVAYDGEQALALAASLRPDVALLDLGMPRLNGYELARRIRAQDWGARMTLIAQTGWGHDSDRQRTREAGFDHHLVKPVDPDALSALLRGLATGREAPRSAH